MRYVLKFYFDSVKCTIFKQLTHTAPEFFLCFEIKEHFSYPLKFYELEQMKKARNIYK
jgi:hypothetical protein